MSIIKLGPLSTQEETETHKATQIPLQAGDRAGPVALLPKASDLGTRAPNHSLIHMRGFYCVKYGLFASL